MHAADQSEKSRLTEIRNTIRSMFASTDLICDSVKKLHDPSALEHNAW